LHPRDNVTIIVWTTPHPELFLSIIIVNILFLTGFGFIMAKFKSTLHVCLHFMVGPYETLATPLWCKFLVLSLNKGESEFT
jgi:hypothetical protein